MHLKSIKIPRINPAEYIIVEVDVREEGRKEGREEGEAKERIKNARAMKTEGIPAAVIARIIGLSFEEIEEL